MAAAGRYAPAIRDELFATEARIERPTLRQGLAFCTREGIDRADLMAAMVALQRGPGRIEADDYFYYRLFDPALDDAGRRAFAGLQLEPALHRLVCDDDAGQLAHDKLRFEAALRAAGLPTPRTVAIYQKGGDRPDLPGCEHLTGRKELARWLGQADPVTVGPASGGLHGKPRLGMRSVGALSLRRTGGDEVERHDGRRVSVRSAAKALGRYEDGGYLFQERLRPDPEVAAVVGDTLASLRLVVLAGPDGPRLYRAAWKLPTGGAVADNFWRGGNLLAGVDHQTGQVVRAISGPGPEDHTITHHPDTGHPLIGLAVPRWGDLVALALTASRQVPGLDLQAWDVAATATGPVLLEVNIGGDYSLPQLALHRGMLEPELVTFLEGCARRRGRLDSFDQLGLASLAG